jgi:hypothetical protein
MRDLQEQRASAGKDVRPLKNCEQKRSGLWPLSKRSSLLSGLLFVFTMTFQLTFL